MGASNSKTSLSRMFLPRGFADRLQFERFPVQQFVFQQALPMLQPGMKALDAGSGSLVEQETRDRLQATGAVIHTCDIAQRSGLSFRADLHHTPARDGAYDVVVCTQVLEHVRQPQLVCNELARVLKPGGSLFLTTPQSAYLHDLPHHYFNFTCYALRQLFENAGLEVVRMEPQGGHFLMLGNQLHYTCNVIREMMTTPARRVIGFLPLLFCRIFFGFVTKSLCLWLDRLDRSRKNTLGWNVVCRKPAPAS